MCMWCISHLVIEKRLVCLWIKYYIHAQHIFVLRFESTESSLKVHIRFSFFQMVEGLVAPIHPETHKVALDGKSNDTVKHLKKGPVTGGCRVEGYVRVKKVNLGLKSEH